ncbi:MAG: hypothetical protein LC689_01980 [Myxococcales bacterium]|nr:hypothetical protein [Myxococcales bacterium]
MKRAALIALLAVCAACKQQDPALMITMTGPFLVPQNANKLHLDVFDFPELTLIRSKDWCYDPTPNCDSLPPSSNGLIGTVTLVQTGDAHHRVKINATLLLGASTVGAGTLQADFQGGATTFLEVPMTRVP